MYGTDTVRRKLKFAKCFDERRDRHQKAMIASSAGFLLRMRWPSQHWTRRRSSDIFLMYHMYIHEQHQRRDHQYSSTHCNNLPVLWLPGCGPTLTQAPHARSRPLYPRAAPPPYIVGAPTRALSQNTLWHFAQVVSLQRFQVPGSF
jgi:hypothetical protein